MSNKPPVTTLMPDGILSLTPKLRFPQFRNAPPWTGKPMGEVYSFKSNNSLSRDQLNYEHGTVKNIHYGDIHTKFSTLFDITKETVPFINPSESLDGFRPENDCVEGDMIFADASEDLEDIGKSIEVVRLNGARAVAGQHTILARPNDGSFVIGFGAYLFKSSRVRTQIQKESQGSKVLGVSATRLTKIKLSLPSTGDEQQKIAECLSSVDELIAAHSQKLDALKTHKKGLMQQLFPREGETQPRLRFPEFQEQWVQHQLGSLCSGISSGRDQIDSDGAFDLYGSTSVIGKTRNPSFNGERILVARVGANAGMLTRTRGAFGVTDNTLIVSLNPSSNIDFLFHYLGNININKLIFGSGQPLITGSILKNLPIHVPTDSEQHCVADCLTSINDLIAAETRKLQALNTHKKGLMQQLFPSPDEVEA